MGERGATRLVALGRVRRAHGIKGEVRVETYHAGSTLLLELDEVVLRRGGEPLRSVRIRSSRGVHGAFLLVLEGISDRNAAKALRGSEILVPRDRFPPSGPGEFYHVDLVGLAVHGPDGARVGEVVRVEASPAHDLLVVLGPEGERLVPMVDVAVRRIDLESGRIDLEPWDEER